MADDYTPCGGHPTTLSFTAGAPIQAGQLVAVTGPDTVEPATTVAGYAGVAGNDAGAVPGVIIPDIAVTVLAGSGVIHETVVSGTAVTAGGYVTAGAGGTLVGGSTLANSIGVAVRAAAVGGLARWLSYK
jgi:hypothetical protein